MLTTLRETPLFPARRYEPRGNLWVKLEGEQPSGSIKHRAALLMLETARFEDGEHSPTIVESTSGNLGYALGFLAPQFGYEVLCMVDELMPPEKRRRLEGVTRVETVYSSQTHDPRAARIARARELGRLPSFRWINQYGSRANYRAHFEGTGPELWQQTQGALRWVVCAVGSGGTACGLAAFFAARSPQVSVIGVEPYGSTIYGTYAGPYLSVGAGLHEPSDIVRQWGEEVAAHAQVPDAVAISEAKRFHAAEEIYLGITSGACLAIARQLADAHPKEMVVAISADYGAAYRHIIATGNILERAPLQVTTLRAR